MDNLSTFDSPTTKSIKMKGPTVNTSRIEPLRTYTKVEDNADLVRDNYSKAIINTDTDAYNAYMLRKKTKLKEKEEINNLKQEVSEIKDLLKELVNQIGK